LTVPCALEHTVPCSRGQGVATDMSQERAESGVRPEQPVGRETVPAAAPVLESSNSYATYLKWIDRLRKAVPITMAICGLGFVVCVNRDDFLRLTLRRDSGMWGWGCWVFGIGVLASLAVTLCLVVERLARSAAPAAFTLRSMFVRFVALLLAVVAVYTAMAMLYGHGQAAGAVLATMLVLIAVRVWKDYATCVAVGFLAAVAIGWTLLGTQSAYQYARWRANEIVAAGDKLMTQYPPSSTGWVLNPNDPRVPRVLRRLGATDINVNPDRVAVCISGIRTALCQDCAELHIYRAADVAEPPIWIEGRGKGGATYWPITDRLWMIVED
jgi:hypothetical protein